MHKLDALLCDYVLQLLTHFKLGQLPGIISLTAGQRTLHSHNYAHELGFATWQREV